MVYEISMTELYTGKTIRKSVHAENRPDAVKEAMARVAKELEPPIHLRESRRRYAPTLPKNSRD